MNFSNGARRWLNRPKDLKIFDKHIIFVKSWVLLYLKMKYGLQCRGEFWTAPPAEKKNTPILWDARCRGQYQSKHVTPSNILETQPGSCDIMSPNNSGQSATADEKARDKDSRWALHRRKTNMHSGLQASRFDTEHQITTFCVFTQHSTVGCHIVPWLHVVLIFCETELRPRRCWSHSYKTMVKNKVVPV